MPEAKSRAFLGILHPLYAVFTCSIDILKRMLYNYVYLFVLKTFGTLKTSAVLLTLKLILNCILYSGGISNMNINEK